MRGWLAAAALAALALSMSGCGEPEPSVATFDSLSGWDIYDSAGHAGNGLRRPSQVSVHDGILTITGTADGTTGGMSWLGHSQRFGQWDIRLRARTGCACYHPVVLLWGSGGGSGVDNPQGEIDLVEVYDNAARDTNSFSIHYGDGSESIGARTPVDVTEWHTYHLVWSSDAITTWIDDNPPYFTTTQTELFPPGSVDLTIQLDWFPQDGQAGGSTASMQVDSVVQYPDPVSQPPPS